MSFRNTIILAVVVVLFGVYLYNVEKPAIEREAQAGKLIELDPDKVTKIDLESTTGKIELGKTGDHAWRVTKPLDTAADTVTIEAMLGALASGEVKKTVDEKPANLAPFGLDKPETTVVLTVDGGKAHSLAFGKKTPIGASAYARRGDETAVILTTDAVRTAVQKSLSDLRDKTLMSFADNDVREITITGVEGEPTILRKEGNDWALVAPFAAKADPAQVRSLLASLRSLRATAFIDDAGSPPDAKYLLTPPRITVELVIGPDGVKKTLAIGGATEDPAKKEIYAQSLPGTTVYVVGSHLYSMAAKKAGDFRDKTVLAFDKAKVHAVTVDRSDGNGFTVERKDAAWTLADAGGASVKEFVAARLVDDLRELKGADLASETGPRPEFGLETPLLTVKLKGETGDLGTIRVAIVGEGADKRIYATADGSKTVYVLQDFVFQRIDKKRADFLAIPTPTAGGANAAPAVAPAAPAPAE